MQQAETDQDYEILELGSTALEFGDTLLDARLAYRTYGTLSPQRDNAIVLPSAYGGTHVDMEWLVGPGNALDTDRYFVIIPNMFTMSLSSSPSNADPTQAGPRFPRVSVLDNVQAQHRLVRSLGIDALHAVVGCSMGAVQAYQWAAAYPDAVPRLAAICGTATTSPHCQVFLDAARGTIELDAAWLGGDYVDSPEAGLRQLGRFWAGWGLSHDFYRSGGHLALGFDSIEAFLVGFWEAYFVARDANNLRAGMWTWSTADVARTPGCADRADALRRITAQCLVMPATTDLYFPPEDHRLDAAGIANARMVEIPGPYGHFSCGGGFADPAAVIVDNVAELMERPAPGR